jgi:hypothetical protein
LQTTAPKHKNQSIHTNTKIPNLLEFKIYYLIPRVNTKMQFFVFLSALFFQLPNVNGQRPGERLFYRWRQSMKKAVLKYAAGALEKLAVGSMLVGLYQDKGIGILIGVVCFTLGSISCAKGGE